MSLGAAANAVAAAPSPQIFSQEDRKIGRSWGFTRSSAYSDATQALGDRWVSTMNRFADCSGEVIAACIAVHRELGPGLLEGIYEECLCRELADRGLRFERQKPVQVSYRGVPVDQAYRIDLIVEDSLLVEIKATATLLPIHAAQVVTYLRVVGIVQGLLVNFNAMTIRDGLRRLSRTHPLFRSSDLPVKKSGDS